MKKYLHNIIFFSILESQTKQNSWNKSRVNRLCSCHYDSRQITKEIYKGVNIASSQKHFSAQFGAWLFIMVWSEYNKIEQTAIAVMPTASHISALSAATP